MLVSIIIVNYNGKSFLYDCLYSLYSITYDDYEVILIDNHSSDGSVDFVKQNFPNVVIKQLEQNFGFAKANNIGADIAKGDLLLFLNNDTKVTEEFLEPLVTEMKSDEIAICQSLLLKPDGEVDSAGDFVDKYGRAYNSKKIPHNTSSILSARGACMLVKKDVFDVLGKFDERFFVSFEDVDLGWRAWIYGYKVVVVPKSIVYHYGGGTVLTMSDEIKFHGAKNTLILSLTNFEKTQFFKTPANLFFLPTLRRMFGMSVKSEAKTPPPLPSLKTILSAMTWVLKNWGYISEKKKQVSLHRRRSTSQLIDLNLVK